MKFALMNPHWTFERSIYFGCREPHLPLEYGYAGALLERAGHEALLVDAQLERLSPEDIRDRVTAFAPDAIVVTTAPSYLFWRCAPPELRAAQETLATVADVPALRIVIGPHASTTPAATLRKLGVDVAVMGESEETLPRLAAPAQRMAGHRVDCICRRRRRPRAGRSARLRHVRVAGAPVAGPAGRAAPASPPPVRCGTERAGRRDGNLARLPLSLHVLREG